MIVDQGDLSDGVESSPNAPAPQELQLADTVEGDIQAFRAKLSKSKRIIVLAGAGLSAASGVCLFPR